VARGGAAGARRGLALQLFTGNYTHSVDPKNRVSVPRKIVEVLRRVGSESEVVVTVGLDGSLFLYPVDAFAQVAEVVGERPLGEAAMRRFRRTFFANAETCSLDRNGRIVLPEALKARSGIEDKVVFVGVGDYVELWAPGRWQAQGQDQDDDYESQARDVFL